MVRNGVIFALLLSAAFCVDGQEVTNPGDETTPTTPSTTTTSTTPSTTTTSTTPSTTTSSTTPSTTSTTTTSTTPSTTTSSTSVPTTPTTTAAPAVCTAAGIFSNTADTTCKTYYRCTASLIRYDYTCPGNSYFNAGRCTGLKPPGCA